MKSLLLDFLKGKSLELKRPVNISLLGFGSTNRAFLELLLPLDNVKISVRQMGIAKEDFPDSVTVYNCENAFSELYEDVIIPSPSVRREKLIIPRHAEVITDYDLLFREENKRMFLVSGSDGKSTTTALASLMLRDGIPTLFTGGNLGTPLILASKDSEAFLLELSSFTLRYSQPKFARALLTNVTPNHLDWHGSIDEYIETKLALIRHSDEPILNLGDPISKAEAGHCSSFCLISTCLTHRDITARYKTEHTVTLAGEKILLDGKEVIPLSEIKRNEKHNISNFCSAIAISIGYADRAHIMTVAREFNGLYERCERFTVDEVEYISSSIDTTPERTRITLEGIGKEVSIILGGRGKQLPLDPLRSPLIKYAKKISLYGDMTDELLGFINSDEQLSKIPHRSFAKLCEAIDYAIDDLKPGDTVLLSPAATSYGEFESYIQRGRFFKDYISTKHKKCNKTKKIYDQCTKETEKK